MKHAFSKILFLFLLSLCILNCEKDEILPQEPQSKITTVGIDESITFLKDYTTSNNSALSKSNNNAPFVIPGIDFISQESLTNTDELITVVPGYTIYNIYSRILLLKIDGNTQSVLYSMVRDENSTEDMFSGKIYITDLEGNYINAFRVTDNVLVSRFLKPETKSSKSIYSKDGEDDCWGIACGMEGEEVVIVAKKPNDIHYIPLELIFRGYGGSENYSFDSWPSGGGSSGSTCSEGYVKDSNGNCTVQVVVEAPDDEILDMEKFLDCIDTSKNAELTIYADQPIKNSTFPFSGKDVGHAFVSISQNGNTVTFGFYPEERIKAFTVANGAIGNNQYHQYDASVSINISASILSSIIDYVKKIPSTYNINHFNCTDYALAISNFTSLNLPSSHSYIYPGGGGSAPSVLAEEIKKLPESNSYTTNGETGNAPAQSGDCN